MNALLTEASRVLNHLANNKWNDDMGYFLIASEYTKMSEDVQTLVENAESDDTSLAVLGEAAMAADDSRLFDALFDFAGRRFLNVVMNDMGISMFFTYGALACMPMFITMCKTYLDDVAVTLRQLLCSSDCDFSPFWAPAERSNNGVGLLYLIHSRGRVSPTFLLQRCLDQGFFSPCAALVVIGGEFGPEDIYRIPKTATRADIKALMSYGLLEAFENNAEAEHWAYLARTLMNDA